MYNFRKIIWTAAEKINIRIRILSLFGIILTISLAAVAGSTYILGKGSIENLVKSQLDNSVRFVSNQITLLNGAYSSKQFPGKLNYVLAQEKASFKEVGLNASIFILNPTGYEIKRSDTSLQPGNKSVIPDDIVQTMLKGRKGNFDILINGKPSTVAYGYIMERDWLYVALVEKSSYLGPVYKLQAVTLISGIIALVIAILLSGLGTRGIVDTLKKINTAVLSADKGNFSIRISATRGGPEMKELAEGINRIMAKFSNVLGELGLTIEELTASSGNLNNVSFASEQSTDYIHGLTSKISENTKEHETVLISSKDAVEKTAALISSMAGDIGNTMSLSKAMIDSVKTGQDSLNQLRVKITDIGTVTKEAVQDTQALGHRLKEVSMIANTIKGISEKTKLLSFNAAIEATKSGESNGFSVIAQEIKKMADITDSSVKKVLVMTHEIQQGIDDILNTSEKYSMISQESTLIANDTDISFNNIMEKAAHTHDKIELISRNAIIISSDIELFTKNMDKISQIITELITDENNISKTVEEHRQHTQMVTESVLALNGLVNTLKNLKDIYAV